MNTRALTIRFLSLSIGCALALPFVACSKKRDEGSSASSASSVAPRAALPSSAGIITGREILSSVGEALNINYSSNSGTVSGLLADYRNFSTSLPKYGDHGAGFSSVMSRLLSNFVAKSCSMSVAKDASVSQLNNRVVFRFIDISQPLTSATNSNPQRWEAFIKHLSYRFWGAVPEADELAILKNFADTIKPLASGTGAAQTQDTATLVCTLIGSSPKAFFKRDN